MTTVPILLVQYRDHLTWRLEQCAVPDHLRPGLLGYFTERQPVGSFLTAVLENHLRDAVLRGDEDSRGALKSLIEFLTWHAPATAWGSPAAVQAWLADQAPVPTRSGSGAAEGGTNDEAVTERNSYELEFLRSREA